MVEETKTVAEVKADLQARQKSAAEGIPGAERAVAKAISAMADIPKGSAPEVYVAASGSLGTAQKALDGAKADVAKIDKALTALTAQADYEAEMVAYNEGIKPCRVVTNPLVTAQQKAVQSARETLTRVGITSVIVRTTLIDGEIETEAELVGADKPKTPKAVRKSGGGGGGNGGRFVNVSPDGSKRLTDREFVMEVGLANIGAEKTAHATNPDTKGGTLYVTARALRDKLGWTREQK